MEERLRPRAVRRAGAPRPRAPGRARARARRASGRARAPSARPVRRGTPLPWPGSARTRSEDGASGPAEARSATMSGPISTRAPGRQRERAIRGRELRPPALAEGQAATGRFRSRGRSSAQNGSAAQRDESNRNGVGACAHAGHACRPSLSGIVYRVGPARGLNDAWLRGRCETAPARARETRPARSESLQVLRHAAALDGVGEGNRILRPVHEAVCRRSRRGCAARDRYSSSRALAVADHGGEALEPLEERVAPLDHADVVERGVGARAQPARVGRACARSPRDPTTRRRSTGRSSRGRRRPDRRGRRAGRGRSSGRACGRARESPRCARRRRARTRRRRGSPARRAAARSGSARPPPCATARAPARGSRTGP